MKPIMAYLFPMAQTRGELALMDYTGRFGKSSTFNWNGMTDPGITPLTSCSKHAGKRIMWFNVFVRFAFIVCGIVLNVLDDKLGDAWKNPEKMIGVLIVCYFVITLVYAILKENASIKDKWFDNQDVPIPLRFAWWCYDMALPGSFGTLILYFQMRQRHYEMTDGVYILNVVLMGLDFALGRMILFPGHFLWYILIVFGAGLFYKNHFNASVEQAVIGFFLMCVWYLVFSWLTYLRAHVTDTWPTTYPEADRADLGTDEPHIVDVEKNTKQSVQSVQQATQSTQQTEEEEEGVNKKILHSWFNKT